MTPREIQRLSDPIEYVYQQMVDELLINIGKHITSPTWTHTASWEIQKLAQLGQLTRENAAIINDHIKKMPQAVRDTMEATRAAALADIEKQLEAAAQAGYVTPPVTDSTVNVLRAYEQQAIDKFNLTNTTMLKSSVDQYVRAVQLTDQEYGKLLLQEENTRNILMETAGDIATGARTRTQAVRKALRKISDEGLTGFVDKAGHNWTPEAYVNMVTRTTVHNVSIEATKARMQDYNTQVFQVSSHAGARPLCYPYQGKFLSWDNTSGEIELGNGTTVTYAPLNSTSYGQPAGLFGINCGHFPIVVIPGVTIPHGKDNIQPPEENAKEYAESQEQRALERQIRKAKRDVEMMGDAATPEDKAKIREAQAKMREFIDRTGRARRYDREQIGGGKERAPKAPKTAEPQEEKKLPEIKPVHIGSVLEGTLGADADEFKKMVEQADPIVRKTYADYADKLNEAERKANDGKYNGAVRKIYWDYNKEQGVSKYSTLSHEYGHHVDRMIPADKYTSREVDTINKAARKGIVTFDVVRKTASTSDRFLTAMRADRDLNKGFLGSRNKEIREDLLKDGRKDITAGVQDAFDGWWSTRDASYYSPLYLPWGHGNAYYNAEYNRSVKSWGADKDVKQALIDLGFDASNQTKVKKIMRDYRTAVELWANIQSAYTVEGEELRYMKKYFPNACAAWEEIAGS